MIRTRVAIIGAGLAGLQAARLLHAASIEFVLVEARTRFGGRILTVDDSGQPADDGFDLGPSWYWPQMQPAIAELVAELRLSAFGQHSDGDVLFERMSREGPQRYAGVAQEQRSWRLVGGSGALVNALVRDLPRERLHLGASVTAMALVREGTDDADDVDLADGVELTIRRDDGMAAPTVERLVVEQVIAAVPPRLLEATVRFSPALDQAIMRRWRETPTWMAPHAKFIAVYDRPFWREAGLSGTAQSMVGPMPETHDATTASGHAALFGFLGVSAEQRAALGEEALGRACVDQLARTFGAEAQHPRATLFKDWAADPLTATDADRAASGHPTQDAAEWVSGPWRERLMLGGSEASASEPGYLAGAVVAATAAVHETLRRIALTNAAVDRSHGASR
jgi:monoamine oxidase